jgi:hypothetical protein
VNKSLTLIPIVAALAVWSSPAAAEPIPSGTIALGAERLTGFFHSQDSVGPIDVTRNKISLLGEPTNGPYDLPRIGIDGFIIDGLSLGGTIAISHTGVTTKGNAGPFNGSFDSSETDFLFAPRVGYALMFSEHIGIWPRGGFSYFLASTSADNGPSTSLHYFSLNIDCPFLFKLAPNFAITAGPVIDVSFEGSQKTEPNGPGVSVTADASTAAFGIAAGLVAFL